jgi:hypothetical protein
MEIFIELLFIGVLLLLALLPPFKSDNNPFVASE